jgi:hypothetical protein
VIGLFVNSKPVAPVLLERVEELLERAGVRTKRFHHPHNRELWGEELEALQRWVGEVDGVIGAVGD